VKHDHPYHILTYSSFLILLPAFKRYGRNFGYSGLPRRFIVHIYKHETHLHVPPTKLYNILFGSHLFSLSKNEYIGPR
jgi:hypothetical protein